MGGPPRNIFISNLLIQLKTTGMKGKTAIVFGATGLTGSEVVRQLLEDERYERVKIFARHDPQISHKKLEVHISDISDVNNCSEHITGDDIFICLGTTIRKAGSIKAMEEADRDIPAAIADVAAANDVRGLAVVSSIGANAGSRNYYLRIKGEMEQLVRNAGITKTVIVRPSMLLGNRNEFRFGEEAGKLIMRAFGFLFVGRLRKYRGIQGADVAAAMIRILNSPATGDKVIYESDEL
jgi:uncharacterized protein YbjT (DUF2867 family)